MLLASGEAGIERMTNLFNRIVDEKELPAEWNTSVIVNCFKNKGEATERGNYRGLKLLEHMMKVFERVIEQEIRRVVDINAMQFGFMPGKGTIDAIFIVRQLQEKYLEKKKKLYFAFVDLEKAFDRVPRDIVKWAMRKLGVDEWLIETVMAMYKNSNSAVRVNNTVGEKFNVEVGVHQGSVLSPLLFIMVLEALSSECRSGFPWEMLYADDLVIIAESSEELKERYSAWKNGMESKGLRVNMAKTKVMTSGTDQGPTFKSGRYPCGVCGKGVGANSVYCTFCNRWVHKRCSGLKRRLRDVPNFKCRRCLHPQEVNEAAKMIKLGNSDYEVVDQFCYLGDMLSAGGGAQASSIMRVRSGWKKFRELLPLLTFRMFSHRMEGRLYAACVRSVMLYGSETWPVKEEEVCRLEHTEMQMVRWMCNVSLRDRRPSEELRNRLGIESISCVMRQMRLRWFGHIERMDMDNWVSKCRNVEVNGARGRGRPRKTWNQVIQGDMRKLGLVKGLAQDRNAWKRAVKKPPSNPC